VLVLAHCTVLYSKIHENQWKMKLAIFISAGGVPDCARHAVLVALKDSRISKVKVFGSAANLEGLKRSKWNCSCTDDHGATIATLEALAKMESIVIDVDDKKDSTAESLEKELQDIDAVISGLGNRQPFLGDRVGKHGTRNVVTAMEKNSISRLVMTSSMGLNEDYPCMEWRWEGKVMDGIFSTLCRRERDDLVGAEKAVTQSSLNYVIVRPVGLGDECVPEGKYFVQKKKNDDVLGPNMAKLDAGQFMVDQVLEPTYEKKAVVLGADPARARDSM
jgi:hypothetical protein